MNFSIFSIFSLYVIAIPLFVYGDLAIDGQPAPLNTEILAEIEGTEITVTIKTVKEGKYFIKIPDCKINVGKTILFKVNGIIVADENYKVADVNTTPSVKFDLSIVTPVIVATASAGGGGGGLVAQSTLPLTSAGDTNGDGVVDVFDFNTLMVNWGKTDANNAADLNNDGKVDVFDFNLLMINWTL